MAIQAQIDEIDLEFLKEDLLKIWPSVKLGADRVRQIILSLARLYPNAGIVA